MDSPCIDFSGCGTLASPLTASPIFDPATDDCLSCGPNGFLIVVDPVTGNQLSCGVNGLLVAPAASGSGISAVALDTSCIDMTVTGDGTLGSPLTISAIPVVDPVTGNQLSCGVNGLLVAPAAAVTGTSFVADSARVNTSETTTSTTYVDLATAGPAVTVETGTRALVMLSAAFGVDIVNAQAWMSVAVSGATTIAAVDANAMQYQGYTAGAGGKMGTTILITGLTPGLNTFTAKYRTVATATATFADRTIAVIAL